MTTFDTLGGVEWVRNTGTPPTWSLERFLKVGSVEEGAAGFGRVFSILADEAGRVFVGDEMLNEIKVFDSAGTLVRTIGREGAGPGEFGRLYSLAWLGDTLVVMDPGNARLGLLSPEGDWHGHWLHQPITGPPTFIRFYRASKTEFHVLRRVPTGDSVVSTFVRFGPSGALDTVLSLAPGLPEVPSSGRYICESPNGVEFYTTPYYPTVILTFSAGGYRVGPQTGAYELVFLDRNGDSVRVVVSDREPVPVSDAEWDTAFTEYREFRDVWSARGAKCEPRAEPSRPAHKPILRHVFFDPDGRMWVEAVTAAGLAFDVFDAAGRLMATLPAPERHDWVEPYVRGDRLYLVSRDTLGVQYVEGYRIVRGGAQ